MAPEWKDYATRKDAGNRGGWSWQWARFLCLVSGYSGVGEIGIRAIERSDERAKVRLKYLQELLMPSGNRIGSLLPGRTGLFAAILIVVVLLIGLPAYRLFFAVSVLLGLGIAGILHLWHKYKPVKEAEVHDDKHPLGLE
jgi:hypothetical protein